MPDAVKYMDTKGTLRLGGGLTQLQKDALDAGKIRATDMIKSAGSVTASQQGSVLAVRVTNLTAHKLISGYPEGRRMWINIKWFDGANALVREDGAYGNIGRHMQLLSNDEGVSGFSWKPRELAAIRAEMDAMLDAYPETVISSKYYHEIITTGTMLGRRFGWMECPSVTQPLDKRDPAPKHLTNFIRWASDLKTMHRCCTSETPDCSTCKDGAAHMSWVMVNKRAHMASAQDLNNWIEVYETFAKLYKFIPW